MPNLRSGKWMQEKTYRIEIANGTRLNGIKTTIRVADRTIRMSRDWGKLCRMSPGDVIPRSGSADSADSGSESDPAALPSPPS